MALVGDMTLSSDTPLSDDYFEVKGKIKKILDNSNYNYQSVKAALYDIAKEYTEQIKYVKMYNIPKEGIILL